MAGEAPVKGAVSIIRREVYKLPGDHGRGTENGGYEKMYDSIYSIAVL